MKSVLFSDYDVRLGQVLPFLDQARFRYTVADFRNPALAMAEFDCIVPFQLKDYFDLWARGDLQRINCLIPSREVMELLDNKYECNRFLAARGFGAHVPAMLGDEDIGRLEAWPIIYKKKYDAYGTQSFLCHSRAELEAIEAATVQTEYFRQEYVPGEVEYSTHMLSVGGRVAYHSAFATPSTRRISSRACGGSRRLRKCASARVRSSARSSARPTHRHLLLQLQDGGGQAKIFEINPRFGQSLARDINTTSTSYRVDAGRAPVNRALQKWSSRRRPGSTPASPRARTSGSRPSPG